MKHLFHYNLGSLDDKENLFSIIFEGLITLTKSYYIYLEIIRKQILTIAKYNKDVESLNKKYSDLWDRVNKTRNRMIIHKEKRNYLLGKGELIATGKDFITHEITVEENGVEVVIELKPLSDLDITKKYLEELKVILKGRVSYI